MNKQCPICGTFVPDNSNFCPNCGHNLTQPPQYNGGNAQYYDTNNAFDSYGPEGKSRGIAALLAIFLGCLGVHYFYVNKATAGVVTILLCIVTCSLWSILTFVQGIYMLCITNAQFHEKYVASNSTFPLF